MKSLVIWAHSECRSNAALYGEVKRLAEAMGVGVTMCLWDEKPMDEVRKVHGLEYIKVGDDLEKGREVLSAHGGKGTVHVICVYQNSTVWRQLIVEAKASGSRVVVSAEAPCEMCVGLKALAKRVYYRFVLPWRVRGCVKAADVFLNASGASGIGRLRRLGWAREKIVPFGYASALTGEFRVKSFELGVGESLRILHTGVEEAYRGVETLENAVVMLKKRGVQVELRHTGGKVSEEEMQELYGWADVFVGCGLCEPWGMRVNDAIHAGLPIVVSSGMGSKWLVEQFGCGAVFKRGDSKELADILERIANDSDYRKRLLSGVLATHEAWTPEARAKVWLDEVLRA
jgi:hypothetical protein